MPPYFRCFSFLAQMRDFRWLSPPLLAIADIFATLPMLFRGRRRRLSLLRRLFDTADTADFRLSPPLRFSILFSPLSISDWHFRFMAIDFVFFTMLPPFSRHFRRQRASASAMPSAPDAAAAAPRVRDAAARRARARCGARKEPDAAARDEFCRADIAQVAAFSMPPPFSLFQFSPPLFSFRRAAIFAIFSRGYCFSPRFLMLAF